MLFFLVTSKTNELNDRIEQFHLALEWNRIDIVQNWIFNDIHQWEISTERKKIHWNEFFLRALHRNQVDFIQFFLDHHFPLRRLFSNPKEILHLYQNELGYSSNRFIKHHQDTYPLKSIWKEIFQPLIGSASLKQHHDDRKG